MTEIASHRGGALLWPENSRIAFENTARLPVEQVEFDVHPTRDGALVVIHDATLDRTTDGAGLVCEQTLEQLSHFTLKGSEDDRILRLQDVLEIFRPTDIRMRIEMKPGPGRVPYPDVPGKLVRMLRDAEMFDRVILTSFQLDTVCAAAAAARPPQHVWVLTPDLLTDVGLQGVCDIATARGVPMLAIRCNRLDAEVSGIVRAAKLGIGAWAVNDEAAIARMLELRIDVFTTDRPDLALRAKSGMR